MTPDRHTNQELMLAVGDGHELYVQDWGNSEAATVIFYLHGGPGSKSGDKHKLDFDPTRQRVIFHDQRGCGRSTPAGSLQHNTTDKLVADINHIADKLGIYQFVITGGSWGSALALVYGIQHPERVSAMVLRGIFTASQAEVDWISTGLSQTFLPEVWQAYLEATPTKYHADPSAYHFKRVLGNDPKAIKESAYALGCMEGGATSLDDRFVAPGYDTFEPAGMVIEAHYLANGCFLPDRHILEKASRLTMPVWLVQGRYDMVCPPITAYQLHSRLPRSELIYTVDGHRATHETWNVMRTVLLSLTI